MKPDAYLKLYPGDWLRDTMQLDATSTGAYFLLILAHRGKPGIQCDDQTLRTIARVRESDWARVKAQIEHYFRVDKGLWINNRSVEDWDRDCAEYKAACDRTNAATLARKKNVTSNVTVDVTTHQSESESESDPQSEACKTNKKGRHPTLTQVKTKASMVNITPEVAEQFWHHFESSGWIDKNGHDVVKWESKLMTWKADAQARPLEQASKNGHGNGSVGISDRVQLNQELQRIIPLISQITNGAASDAMGQRFYTPDDKKRLISLKQRRDEIRKLIGAKY